MLVVFSGLPGVGKTTIARATAGKLHATYLRIDSIEQAMRSAGVLAGDVGPAGYMAAFALAEANLRLGQMVIADCVNPVPDSRAAWQAVAVGVSVPLIEVEVICSDLAEHRRRVESRTVDVPGLVPPGWDAIRSGGYQPWQEPRFMLDTAILDAASATGLLCDEITRRRVAPAD